MNVQAYDLTKWYTAVPGVSVLLGLVVSYAYLYRCNFAELGGGQGRPIYFAEIAKRTESKFLPNYETVSEAGYRLDMLSQVWRNSTIICAKYQAVAAAIHLWESRRVQFASTSEAKYQSSFQWTLS